MHVRVVVDLADASDFRTLRLNIFSKTKKVRGTVFSCSFGTQIESFKQQKSRDTDTINKGVSE